MEESMDTRLTVFALAMLWAALHGAPAWRF
jgi:hypothetical protein